MLKNIEGRPYKAKTGLANKHILPPSTYEKIEIELLPSGGVRLERKSEEKMGLIVVEKTARIRYQLAARSVDWG